MGNEKNPPARRNPFTGTEGVGDFFGPFFTVKFFTISELAKLKTADGQTVNLGEIGTGDTVTNIGLELSSRLRSYAPQLEIVNKGGSFMQATLTLDPPFEDAIKIVDNRDIQYHSLMLVEWGWLGGAQSKRISSGSHLFIITQPQLTMSGVDFQITITGIDLHAHTTQSRSDHRTWKRSKYFNDFKILEEIVGKNGMRIDVSQAPFGTGAAGVFSLPLGARLPASVTGSSIFFRRPLNDSEQDPEQNDSDWAFFQKILADNNCKSVSIDDTVYIVDQNFIKTTAPVYTLVFFRQPQTDREIPLMSFQANALPILFFPRAAIETTVVSADPDTGKVTKQKHDPNQMSDEQHTGARSAAGRGQLDGRRVEIPNKVPLTPNPKFTGNQTGKRLSLPHRTVNRVEAGKRVARTANTIANTDATATMPGVPHLVPMQIVRCEVGSKVFSGNYRILEVTHRLSTDGYDTEVKLVREGSTGDGKEGKGTRSATGGNEQEPTKKVGEGQTPIDTDGKPL